MDRRIQRITRDSRGKWNTEKEPPYGIAMLRPITEEEVAAQKEFLHKATTELNSFIVNQLDKNGILYEDEFNEKIKEVFDLCPQRMLIDSFEVDKGIQEDPEEETE